MSETFKTSTLDCSELNIKTPISIYFKATGQDTAKATVQFLDKTDLKRLADLENYDIKLNRANKSYITIEAKKYK